MNLPLQVAEVDDVEIDDADAADAGGGEIHRGRRAEAAGADAQHLAGLQLALPVHADLRHDQVPAVALDFVVGELGQRCRRFVAVAGAPPATDGMMLSVSPGVHRRLLLLQVADVFVVQVDVDEAAQLALVVVEVRLAGPACLVVRSASSSPTVAPSASTASCLSVNGRSGVGIRIFVAIQLALIESWIGLPSDTTTVMSLATRPP